MQTIHVSADFPLNRWVLIVVVMMAIVFTLPVFAGEESSNAIWECVRGWVVKLLPDVVTGVVAGVVTVMLAARMGLRNFREGMLHNKKAEIYERLLAALHTQKEAYDAIFRNNVFGMKYGKCLISPEDESKEKERAEQAKKEWFSAISAAELYLPPESVNALRAAREKANKAIGKDGTDIDMMLERSTQLEKLVEDVKKQARKDIGVRK